jgi:heat shock protein HslJ
MYRLKWIFIVFGPMLFISSCSNSIEPEELLSIEISQVINTQWNLISVETPSHNLNMNNYEPFKVVLMTNEIWGTDNCNFLQGNYFFTNDSLTISNGAITEMGCPFFTVFPFNHLFSKPEIKMRGTQLVLLKNDTTYVYHSDFTKTFSQLNFLNDTLSLNNSNDNNISFFDSLGLYPKVILTSNREFNIQWYNKSPENTGFINQYSGIFGINENKNILFTKINSSYEGNGVSIVDWELVDRIIGSEIFEYNNSILKIFNTHTNTYYEFNK